MTSEFNIRLAERPALRVVKAERAREPLETLAVIAVGDLAEFFNGGSTNRELALEAAEEFAISRGWK